MSQNYNKLAIEPEDVNILLVGESNAGKSTFAHAFANYIKYPQFSVAQTNKVSCLFPSFLNETNTSYEADSANVRDNLDGQQKGDIVPTKNACSYVFPLLKYGRRIHLIDTPGFGDVFQDINNFDSILTYVNQAIEHLHAICFVVKPNNSTEILAHECHIKFLLSRLEDSAHKNIIFLFTHSQDSCYSSEYVDTVLNGIFEQIERQADIEFEREQVFSLDNEAFCFLVSAKGNTIKKTYPEIWDRSVAECWRMIEYILGKGNSSEEITPHRVQLTVKVHNARQIISRASHLFVDIADIIKHLETRNFVLTQNILSGANQSDLAQEKNYNTVGKKKCVRNNCDFFICANDVMKIYLEGTLEAVGSIEREISAYVSRKQKIESDLRILAGFVKFSALLSNNDSYEAYIKCLINQKAPQAAEDTDPQTIVNYHHLLKKHTEEIRIISNKQTSSRSINTSDILKGVQQLKALEEIKEKFQELHEEVVTKF